MKGLKIISALLIIGVKKFLSFNKYDQNCHIYRVII